MGEKPQGRLMARISKCIFSGLQWVICIAPSRPFHPDPAARAHGGTVAGAVAGTTDRQITGWEKGARVRGRERQREGGQE